MGLLATSCRLVDDIINRIALHRAGNESLPMDKRIRIKDIAAKAGVSKGTVDRVLHNRGNVSPEARAKVAKAMERLDYEPNVIASALASKKGWRIATLLPDSKNDPFWEQPRKGILRAKRTLRDYGMIIDFYFFRDADPDHFKCLGQQILEQPYDALLVAPSFLKEGHDLLDKCEENNLKYILINTLLKRDHPCYLGYIGQDSYSSGVVAAKLLNFELKEGDTAIIIHLEKEVYNAKHLVDKQAGFEEFYNRNTAKKINIVQLSFGDVLDRKNLEAFIKQMFIDYPGVKGIFVSTSKLFRIVPYIKKYAKGHVGLIGFDLIEPNLKYLDSEDIHFLINQNPYKQGFMGVMNLFNHLVLKKEIKPLQFLPLDVVMRENVQYYVEEEHEKLHIVI